MATPTVRLVANIPPEIHAALASQARIEAASQTSIIIEALSAYFAKHGVYVDGASGGKAA